MVLERRKQNAVDETRLQWDALLQAAIRLHICVEVPAAVDEGLYEEGSLFFVRCKNISNFLVMQKPVDTDVTSR